MKLRNSRPARTTLLLLVASACLLKAANAQQAGTSSQRSNPAPLQPTPPAGKFPKAKRAKAPKHPSPEDTLSACVDAVQKLAEFEEKKAHPTPFPKTDPEIKQPHVIQFADARFSKEARKKHIQGESIIALTVTTDGLPADMCLLKSLGYGLDEEAAAAVRQYKFAPATKSGQAIAVPINVEVRFRLY